MEPYIGEIRMFAGNFAPVGWEFCHGQELAISRYPALFTLIGTTYGGDGETTFALPDLRGRVPVALGSNNVLGEMGGAEAVTLTTDQLPTHTHVATGSSNGGNSTAPTNNVWATSTAVRQFVAGTGADANMNSGVMATAGGNQPHENMLPYLAVNFIIAVEGIFPPRD